MTARGALAIVAVLAGTARADDLASQGPLAMHAPADLVLGRDTRAEIHLAAGAARLVTSAGELEPLVADGAGARAILHLPEQRYPQLAIVAALDARGAVLDWLAIPLAGQATVRVQTDARASVVVRIAGHELGPTVADGAGVALVPVIVPPGVRDGVTIATSVYGRATEKPLALGARPYTRALALCGADRVSVVAVDGSGAPATAAPALAISTGSIGAPVAKAPGVFEATVAPEGDEVTVVASYPGEETAATTCTVTAPPEPPRAATLAASRDRFVAGGGAIELRVALAYAGKHHSLEPALALAADLGTVGPLARDGDGWVARWTLPDALAGRTHARAHLAVTWPDGRLDRDLDLALAPAPAAAIAATAPPRLRADGRAGAELVVAVTDRFGNRVLAAPHASATGEIGELHRRDDGLYVARYTAPRSRVASSDTIDLRDDPSGLHARVVVPLAPLPKRFAFGARAGVVSNLGRMTAPVLALTAETRLPVLDEHLVAGGELALYHAGLTAAASDGERLDAGITAVPLLARVAYRVPLGHVELWGGAGLGAAFVATTARSPSTGDAAASAFHLAASAFAGGAYHAAWGDALLELGYLQLTSSSGPVQGRLGGLAITAGYGRNL